MSKADEVGRALRDAGFRCEIYTGKAGVCARILGEVGNYAEVERIVGRLGASWVTDAQSSSTLARLGYPTKGNSAR